MSLVHHKLEQADLIAHLLDAVVRLPGTRTRFGADPLVGLIPVVGDLLATLAGASILVITCQLQLPRKVFLQMATKMFLNGVVGAVPFAGDAFSFAYKSNARNAALLLRTIKHSPANQCPLQATPLTLLDLAWVAGIIFPTLAATAFIGLWFWQHDISYLTLFFPPVYRSR